MNDEKFIFDLQVEFLQIARQNLSPDDEEAFSDVIDEATWQISDWYNGESYYVKPEDILQEYFFLTPKQAHRFLPIFKSTLKMEENHDC